MSNRTSQKRKKAKKKSSHKNRGDSETSHYKFPSSKSTSKEIWPLEEGLVPEQAREEAQRIAYDAMEASDPEDKVMLIEEALKANPMCVDALMMTATMMSETPLQYINMTQLAIEAGRMELGEEFMEENKGHFWGLLETRPYMRACAALAEILVDIGLFEDAIIEYEKMLELNPGDNQGMRYPLLALYLQEKHLDDAHELLLQHEEETMAVFTWGRVLLGFIDRGPDYAETLLDEADERNPYMQDYLTGFARLPKDDLGFHGFGDENEAIVAAKYLKPAWKKYPKAVAWLKDML